MRVLLCVDGSKYSFDSLSFLKINNILQSKEVFVLNVISEERLSVSKAFENKFQEKFMDFNIKESLQILEKAKELIADCGCQKIEICYRLGNPSKEILKFQKENQIDMIIISSRGLGAFSRSLLGSVSNKVTNKAECPVLVIKRPKLIKKQNRIKQ